MILHVFVNISFTIDLFLEKGRTPTGQRYVHLVH